jgi:alkylation response protein AidB-like acyl-CoA dehydrogenase
MNTAGQVLVDPGENERMVRDGALGFVSAHHSMKRVRQMRSTDTGYSRDTWKALADAGWLGLRVPESLGGGGMGLAEVATLCDVFGEALLPEPWITCGLWPAALVSGCGQAAARERLLPGLLSGDTVLALAWQDAPFHLDSAQTSATLAGTPMTLQARKRFVASGVGADGWLVTALQDGVPTLVYVPATAAGVSVRGERQMDGSICADFDFNQVPVRAEDVLAEGDAAVELLRAAQAEATLAVCAVLNAVANRALAITVDYLGKRVQFGKRIGSFQALQHRAVDLAVRCTLAGSVLRRAIESQAEGSARAASDLSAAKAICSRTATLVTRSAIQLHGGIGYTDEYDIGLYVKSALRHAGWLGTAQLHASRFMATKPVAAGEAA